MDYFNEKERAEQAKFSAMRDRIFDRVTNVLARLGVQPNQITLLSILLLIAGCVLGPRTGLEGWMLWIPSFLLFFYCALDGIDGPLARRIGRGHDGGSIVDIAADQLGVILVPAAAVFHLGSDPVGAILFSNFYVAFIAVVVFGNGIGLEIPKFLRVKYPFYFAYCLSLLIPYNITELFMQIFAAYYGFMLLKVIMLIYRHYDQKRD